MLIDTLVQSEGSNDDDDDDVSVGAHVQHMIA